MKSPVKEILETEEKKDILSNEEQAQTAKALPPEEKRKGNFSLFSLLVPVLCFFVLFLGILLGKAFSKPQTEEMPAAQEEDVREEEAEVERYGFPEWITPVVLTLDGVSRSGEKLEAVRDIAVHYVANPGSTAMANRDYFEGPDSSTSAHFIVGLDGEILLLIPPDERSCATNKRNIDTLSVEVCHPDETGVFLPETRESLVRLLAHLCVRFDLTEENLIRHYDVTGKMCPLYYVENPLEWEALKEDVKNKIQEGEI